MDKEQKKEIGKRLRALREKTGKFQQDVAEIVGVDRASISNYEIGRAFPPSKVLAQLADLFNTSTDFILGKTENSDPFVHEKEFLSKIELSDDELLKQFSFEVDGRPLSPREIKKILAQVRFDREND